MIEKVSKTMLTKITQIVLNKLFRYEHGGILIYDNEAIMANQPVPSFDSLQRSFKGKNWYKTSLLVFKIHQILFLCYYNRKGSSKYTHKMKQNIK